jgi:hypothetical protein
LINRGTGPVEIKKTRAKECQKKKSCTGSSALSVQVQNTVILTWSQELFLSTAVKSLGLHWILNHVHNARTTAMVQVT